MSTLPFAPPEVPVGDTFDVDSITAVPLADFFVPGEPVSRLSPKARVIQKGVHSYAQIYADAADKPWMSYVRTEANRVMNYGVPHSGALALRLDFTFHRPPSVSVKKRPYPSVKPDADNLAKSVKDALKALLFEDDALIVDLFVSKRYSDHPGVRVRLWRLDA